MSRRHLTRIRVLYAISLAVAVSVVVPGGRVDTVDARRAERPRCPQADIQSVLLDSPTPIDGVRVVVARRSPIGGAALIRIDSGDSDRVVHIRGGISKLLQFSPAITTDELEVSLDPVFDAARGACIERIDLLSNGQRVASVKPE